MAEMKVRSDVTPSLHPEILSTEVPSLSEGMGRSALEAGQTALTKMYDTLGRIRDAEHSIAAAPANGGKAWVMGKVRSISDAAEGFHAAVDQAVESTARNVDKQVERLRGIEAGLADRVWQSVNVPDAERPTSVAVAQEVRDHFRGLPKGRRFTEASAAIEAGDRRTLAAIFSAPSYLSGFSDADIGTLRDAAGNALAPVEFAALQATRKVTDKVIEGGNLFMNAAQESKKLTVERNATRVKARKSIEAIAS